MKNPITTLSFLALFCSHLVAAPLRVLVSSDAPAFQNEYTSALKTGGTDVETSEKSIALAKRHDGFHATVGLHPTEKVVDLVGDVPDPEV